MNFYKWLSIDTSKRKKISSVLNKQTKIDVL